MTNSTETHFVSQTRGGWNILARNPLDADCEIIARCYTKSNAVGLCKLLNQRDQAFMNVIAEEHKGDREKHFAAIGRIIQGHGLCLHATPPKDKKAKP